MGGGAMRRFCRVVAELCVAFVLCADLLAGTVALGAPPAQAHPNSAAACRSFVRVLDVSRWQGQIDWGAVARDRTAGVAGAWIKAGGADGGLYHDQWFGTNVTGATAASLPWGGYFFTSPGGNPEQQADYFVSLGGAHGTLPPLEDVETRGGLSDAGVLDFTARFAARITSDTGRIPVVYIGGYFVYGTRADLARLGNNTPAYPSQARNIDPCAWGLGYPTPQDSWKGVGWDGWQFTDNAGVAGIAGGVDESIVAPEAWARWTGAGVQVNPGPDPAPSSQQVISAPAPVASPKVAQIQRIVGVTPDGFYGPATKAAVARWQRALGLTPDGIWGPRTEQATAVFFAFLASHPIPPSTPPTIALGASGGPVARWQQALRDRGVWIAVDSHFGPATRAATVWWQQRHGLAPDGVVGPATWASVGA